MLILSLDTSSSSASLAVLRDNRVIGSVSSCTGELYSSRMFRRLDFLLRELSLRLEDFDLFAVASGPGSFTGLRVGLAAVKGWAEVYHKPIAPVSGLEAVAAQSQSQSADRLLVPVLDARRRQVYFGVYRSNGPSSGSSGQGGLVREGDERVMALGELFEVLETMTGDGLKLTIVTPVPELLPENVSPCETAWSERSVRIEHVSSELAPHIGRLGWLRAQQGRLADSLTLDANYVRRSDAELHWKASTGI